MDTPSNTETTAPPSWDQNKIRLLAVSDHGRLGSMVARLPAGIRDNMDCRDTTPEKVLNLLAKASPDCIVLDPDTCGLLSELRSGLILSTTIVFVMGCRPSDISGLLAAGASECLLEGCSEEEFCARVENQLRLRKQLQTREVNVAVREKALDNHHQEWKETTAELTRRNRELEMIDAIVQSVYREREFEAVVNSLLRQGMDILPGACNAVYLEWDPVQRYFHFASVLGYDLADLSNIRYSRKELIRRLTTGVRQLERGVYLSRNQDVLKSPNEVNHNIPMPRATLAMLVNPSPGMEGFMVWDNPNEPGAFDDSDVRRLTRFRRHAVAALDKAWSFDQIRHKNEEILAGLRYAHQVQEAMRPKQSDLAHLPPSFVLHQPRDLIATDFVWTAGDQRSGYLAVGDCSGHNLAGALVSVIVLELLNRGIRENIGEPSALMQYVHESLRSMLSMETAEYSLTKTEIAICRFDRVFSRVVYAGARCPLYWIKAKGSPRSKSLKGDRNALGIGDSSTHFSSHELSVNPGDMLYFATDGYALQQNGQKKKYGIRAFNNLLQQLAQKDLGEQESILLEEFTRYRGEFLQQDDITVAGVRLD